MSYSEELEKINALKEEIEQLLPLSNEAEEKLWKKLRLEWNFNSNHIEGNTLTYFETRLFLLLGNTSGDHKAREYDEMKAHDVAVETVKNWANDKGREITEKEIRELNKIILVSSFWKDAQTPDGSVTKREIIPGEYKKYPNHVRLENGEIFHYAEPDEVSPKMLELMEWYHNSNNLHPVEKAGLLHYKFVRIHPFDDGNGRIARLLMNYHLIRNGYAPIIIKSSDKKNYIFALNKADAGDVESFIEYIFKQSIWTMKLFLLAAKNENIEEDEDWKKNLKILGNKKENDPFKMDMEILDLRLTDTVFPMLNLIISNFEKYFQEVFYKVDFTFYLSSLEISSAIKAKNSIPILTFLHDQKFNEPFELIGIIKLMGYKRDKFNVFDLATKFMFDFQLYYYTIQSLGNSEIKLTKGYKEKMNEIEMENILNKLGKFIYSQIENKIS